MTAFTDLVEVTSERLGARIVGCNDEFFAPASDLLKVPDAVWREGEYTDRGKWMDGWESRRKRTPGHDWAIVRLGLPGLVRGLLVDTSHFKGNYPEACSIDASSVGGYPDAVRLREKWEPRLGKWPAAAAAMIAVLRTAEPIPVTVDGEPVDVWMLFVGNGHYAPGDQVPMSRPRLHGGTLDLRYLRADLPLSRLRLAVAAATFARVHHARFMTIGVLDGAARGGGCEFLSALDVRLGTPRAVIGQPEVPLGILPGAGGTGRWARLAGRARALELLLTGRDIDADEALELGWLLAIHDPTDVDAAALDLARSIARMSAASVAGAVMGGFCENSTSSVTVLPRGATMRYSCGPPFSIERSRSAETTTE